MGGCVAGWRKEGFVAHSLCAKNFARKSHLTLNTALMMFPKPGVLLPAPLQTRQATRPEVKFSTLWSQHGCLRKSDGWHPALNPTFTDLEFRERNELCESKMWYWQLTEWQACQKRCPPKTSRKYLLPFNSTFPKLSEAHLHVLPIYWQTGLPGRYSFSLLF